MGGSLSVLGQTQGESFNAPKLGRLVGVDPGGEPLVAFQGMGGAVVARWACASDVVGRTRATTQQRQVVLLFEEADPLRPLIVGVLDAAAGPAVGPDGPAVGPDGPAAGPDGSDREAAAVPTAFDLSRPRADGAEAPPDVADVDVRVDGERRRLRVRAEDELVLECGQARITLRRNGRVLISGTRVETAAAGTNRIKGGNVRIN